MESPCGSSILIEIVDVNVEEVDANLKSVYANLIPDSRQPIPYFVSRNCRLTSMTSGIASTASPISKGQTSKASKSEILANLTF